jgi:hypothetical protein
MSYSRARNSQLQRLTDPCPLQRSAPQLFFERQILDGHSVDNEVIVPNHWPRKQDNEPLGTGG